MIPKSMHIFRWLAALPLALAPVLLTADTVYKTIDKDGKVTYSSSPGSTDKPGAAKTVEVPIDPNQNVIPSEKSANTKALEQQHHQIQQRNRNAEQHQQDNREQRVAQAEAALQRAEQALQAGQTAQPGDFIGKKDGGTRPTGQRAERLKALQEAVERAREQLESVKYNRE
jgi:hypothetical protein